MPVSGVYLFTYTVNTFVNAYQLVVQLVVDGVNYSDGVSDPFHAGQVKIIRLFCVCVLFNVLDNILVGMSRHDRRLLCI